MGTDAIANTCAAASYDVNLATEIRNVLVWVEGVMSEHVSCLGMLF